MDSITQFALGAAVGEAIAGKESGYRGALVGGLLGTLPDLDVLAYPLLTEMQQLAFHRGITHSIFFAAVAAPLIGQLLVRIYRKQEVSARTWTLVAFWCIVTHFILDSFTVYGTQIFQPFSNYPVMLSSIFIIDPLYSVPLVLGVVVALLFRKNPFARKWANLTGIALSTLYLAFTFASKHYAQHVITRALEDQGVAYERILTSATALNSVLWYGLAEVEDGYQVGLYSLFDADQEVRFSFIPSNKHLVQDHLADPALQRLQWFSHGYYVVEDGSDALTLHDLRFGRLDGWLTDEASYIFSFDLEADPETPGVYTGFKQRQPDIALDEDTFRRLWARMMGQKR